MKIQELIFVITNIFRIYVIARFLDFFSNDEKEAERKRIWLMIGYAVRPRPARIRIRLKIVTNLGFFIVFTVRLRFLTVYLLDLRSRKPFIFVLVFVFVLHILDSTTSRWLLPCNIFVNNVKKTIYVSAIRIFLNSTNLKLFI